MVAKKKKVKTGIMATGKRKTAVARAHIYPGTGKIYFNGLNLTATQSPVLEQVVSEPLTFVENRNFDVDLEVRGGGISGQAQAARTAIAKAMVEFTHDLELEKRMIAFDRSLLVNDSRQVEPKKFKGPKARARFTKSYR